MSTVERMGRMTWNEGFRIPTSYKPMAEAYNSPISSVPALTGDQRETIEWNVLSQYEVEVITDPEGAYEILQMLGVID